MVPYVEFNDDGTKLLIAQQSIGNYNTSDRTRLANYREGYLKIIDRVSTQELDNKVRISFDIDPLEKSQYQISYFNDLHTNREKLQQASSPIDTEVLKILNLV